METEKQVEQYLKKRVEELGGLCYKFISPGRVSVPDRICVLYRFTCFVECKGTKGHLSGKQEREIARLRLLEANVYVVSSIHDVNQLIDMITKAVQDALV
jgi:hypothetical protein